MSRLGHTLGRATLCFFSLHVPVVFFDRHKIPTILKECSYYNKVTNITNTQRKSKLLIPVTCSIQKSMKGFGVRVK